MRLLLVLLRKDLRLLWRDRAGLVFLTIAPIVVITVAGFSLATLYGASPSGQTAYDFPFVDEDHSQLSEAIRRRLEYDSVVHFHAVVDRAGAQRLVQDKRAGAALVVPRGTEAALRAGHQTALVLYTDPVKYLERLNVEIGLLRLQSALVSEQRARLREQFDAERTQLQTQLRALQAAADAAHARLEKAWAEAQMTRAALISTMRSRLERAQQETVSRISRQAAAVSAATTADIRRQMEDVIRPSRAYFASLTATRAAFESWLGDLQRLAGSHAADIPPPPRFPEVPEAVSELLGGAQPALHFPDLQLQVDFPAIALPDLAPLPELPELPSMTIALPPPPPPAAAFTIDEVNLSGGAVTVNTFDQNVPGFSVTFLLLGMLLGVSLGLLDERDWGTFDRIRAMPVTAAQVLIGKLLSRFVVGVVQMVALFVVGWLAFGISLGPQPWGLLLPTVGIVFAGTALGLIVAALATSREAVLPVGSMVIVTMAAVGGCWWPIDLEPQWMRTVALAFPTTWAMDAFNDLMIRRRPAMVALLPTAILLAYGVVYLTTGVLLFRRQLRHRA